MTNALSKLVLGSANFGLDYGLANEAGKVTRETLIKIVSTAQAAGIKLIDTAQAYGDSEIRLASIDKAKFDIITKIGVELEDNYSKESVVNLVNKSLKRLNRRQVYAILLHRPEALLGSNGPDIIAELKDLKEHGIIAKVGVSIYSPDIIEPILKVIDLDIVQAPFNILDQRILTSGWAKKLKEKGTELHTRSVFLQGLLLMRRNNLHKYFLQNWSDVFEAWYKFQLSSGMHASQIALSFALKQPWIDKVVIGVDSAEQLSDLVKIENEIDYLHNPHLVCEDLNLIDPSRWKIL